MVSFEPRLLLIGVVRSELQKLLVIVLGAQSGVTVGRRMNIRNSLFSLDISEDISLR